MSRNYNELKKEEKGLICEEYFGNSLSVYQIALKLGVTGEAVKLVLQEYIGNGTPIYVNFVFEKSNYLNEVVPQGTLVRIIDEVSPLYDSVRSIQSFRYNVKGGISYKLTGSNNRFQPEQLQKYIPKNMYV